MMMRQKVTLERQLDDKLYQFLIPNEGNWNEVLLFAREIGEHASKQIEAAVQAKEEVKEEPKAE